MRYVEVDAFGGPEVLRVREEETPEPGSGEVRVRLTSVGMNHAELMGRRGAYKLSTGSPPFVLGLEGGGVVEAVGDGVEAGLVGRRVVLVPGVSRERGGTYRTHYVCGVGEVLPAPDALADELLGAVWLSHLTAWGCLVWLHGRRGYDLNGRTVGIAAASSSVGLAAAQVVRHHGGRAIGLTSSPGKAEAIARDFDEVVVTHDRVADGSRVLRRFGDDLKRITNGKGVDVFFDCVGNGAYLNEEVRRLATHGTVYVYGLLGDVGPVDVGPLIRKHAAIVGYVNDQLIAAGEEAWRAGCEAVLRGFEAGVYTQRVAARFGLEDVRAAHEEMERGGHVGKLLLLP